MCTVGQQGPLQSAFDRPFKLLVKNETFFVDHETLAKQSPIFAVMCYGKDFANGRELAREIVDEKSEDIQVFLQCLELGPDTINENNFATLIRLANKYQVASLNADCHSYILEQLKPSALKADQIVTLLLSAIEFHMSREVIAKLVRRMAEEEKPVFNRMKLSRLLPAQIYGAIMGTNLNLTQIREIETMNGHVFRMERFRTQYKRAVCERCKKITDATICDGCRGIFCMVHWKAEHCTSDYGSKMLKEMKQNIIELDWPE